MTALLTVERVRQLVLSTAKEWAVMIAYAGEGTQYVTYGTKPEDKSAASRLAQQIAAWVDGGGTDVLNPSAGPEVTHESFVLDAARNKDEVERLRACLVRVATWLELNNRRDAVVYPMVRAALEAKVST